MQTKEILYDRLIFSNIDDVSGAMLPTIVKKGASFLASKSGTYAFCFDNKMARWTAKVMTFDLDISDPNDPQARAEKEALEARQAAWLTGSDVDAKTAVVLMRAATNRIHAKLAQLENDQMFHFHRERRHRGTVESTNARVQWWSLSVGTVIVLVSAFQILIVKRWTPDEIQGGMGGLGRPKYGA